MTLIVELEGRRYDRTTPRDKVEQGLARGRGHGLVKRALRQIADLREPVQVAPGLTEVGNVHAPVEHRHAGAADGVPGDGGGHDIVKTGLPELGGSHLGMQKADRAEPLDRADRNAVSRRSSQDLVGRVLPAEVVEQAGELGRRRRGAPASRKLGGLRRNAAGVLQTTRREPRLHETLRGGSVHHEAR